MTIEAKTDYLLQGLEEFISEKAATKSDHLVIGGDFNLNLDDFEQKNIDHLNRIGLKVVPYSNQREGQKFDGLICDRDILVSKVTVYTDIIQKDSPHNKQNDVVHEDPTTTVVYSQLPKDVMDHHPIRF